eukprot:227980-Chlamydomonas_euryale.AAC.1
MRCGRDGSGAGADHSRCATLHRAVACSARSIPRAGNRRRAARRRWHQRRQQAAHSHAATAAAAAAAMHMCNVVRRRRLVQAVRASRRWSGATSRARNRQLPGRRPVGDDTRRADRRNQWAARVARG